MSSIHSKPKKEGFLRARTLIPFRNSVLIPSYIFKNRQLSVLEVLVQHLKEVRRLKYREIARLLNRDERNIWTVYDRVLKKILALSAVSKQAESGSHVLIPSSVFRDRTVSVLEALVEHLHDAERLTYHEIGMLLARDERTIWTAYARSKEKRKLHEKV